MSLNPNPDGPPEQAQLAVHRAGNVPLVGDEDEDEGEHVGDDASDDGRVFEAVDRFGFLWGVEEVRAEEGLTMG